MKKYFFLDPIHGNIELNTENPEDKLILDLIETSEFQRLRRIRQLGFSYLTFYGAEGTRFVHSIGAFEVARTMLNKLSFKQNKLVEPHRLAILVAALLHDLGHGPFSHSSEPAFLFEHEDWTINNIIGKTEINQVLNSFDKSLVKKVVSILTQKVNPSWVSQIISGQLDCDRADYLIRDSHQTGTKYGVFQLERVIQSLELEKVDGDIKLVVNEKGIHAVEDYLFARYSMYLQVYHHKKTLSADALFTSLISRARHLLAAKEKLEVSDSMLKWLNHTKLKMNLQDFWEVDDICMLHHLKLWAETSNDSILKDLSSRLLNRKLFRAKRLERISVQEIKKIQKKLGDEACQYYCLMRECKEFPYSDRKKPILVKQNGKIRELSQASSIAKALINKGKELDVQWFFYPQEIDLENLILP